jgi:hypothetical protein
VSQPRTASGARSSFPEIASAARLYRLPRFSSATA